MKSPVNAGLHEVFARDFVTVRKYPEVGRMIICHHKGLTRLPGFENKAYDRAAVDLVADDRFSFVTWEDLEGEQTRLPLEEPPKKAASRKDESVSRSLRRIRQRSRDILYSTRFSWWVTVTVDKEKCDRYRYDEVYQKMFRETIKTYNKGKRSDRQLKYFFVPEQHADGAIHLHGFLKGVARKDIRRNEHGYLEVGFIRETLGFMNMQSLRTVNKEEYGKTVGYALKYVEKAMGWLPPNCHAYFCSQGLKRGKIIRTVYTDEIEAYMNSADYVFENEYCRVAYLTVQQGSV